MYYDFPPPQTGGDVPVSPFGIDLHDIPSGHHHEYAYTDASKRPVYLESAYGYTTPKRSRGPTPTASERHSFNRLTLSYSETPPSFALESNPTSGRALRPPPPPLYPFTSPTRNRWSFDFDHGAAAVPEVSPVLGPTASGDCNAPEVAAGMASNLSNPSFLQLGYIASPIPSSPDAGPHYRPVYSTTSASTAMDGRECRDSWFGDPLAQRQMSSSSTGSRAFIADQQPSSAASSADLQSLVDSPPSSAWRFPSTIYPSTPITTALPQRHGVPQGYDENAAAASFSEAQALFLRGTQSIEQSIGQEGATFADCAQISNSSPGIHHASSNRRSASESDGRPGSRRSVSSTATANRAADGVGISSSSTILPTTPTTRSARAFDPLRGRRRPSRNRVADASSGTEPVVGARSGSRRANLARGAYQDSGSQSCPSCGNPDMSGHRSGAISQTMVCSACGQFEERTGRSRPGYLEERRRKKAARREEKSTRPQLR